MRVIKTSELRNIWQRCKNKLQNKINLLNHKQNPIKDGVPAKYMEILIGDEELEAKYGECVPEVAIYGGIQASENVKSFLRLPANLRLYNRI